MPSAKCGGFRDEEVGKFLVLRRDGTVPDWSWFVLGAADPHAPDALIGYADSILDKEDISPEMESYALDINSTAAAFAKERMERKAAKLKKGDPEAGPHRKDCPLIIALMKGEVTFEEISKLWEAEQTRKKIAAEHPHGSNCDEGEDYES